MPHPRLSQLKELVRPYYLKWVYFNLRAGNRPTGFEDCWDYPTTELDAAHTWPAPDDDRADILFLPMGDWHTRVQRTHHLATTFASLGHRCFYLNPHLGREFASTYPRSPRCVVGTLEPRIFELHVHLLREPVFHHRCLRPDEDRAVFDAIDRLLRKASTRHLEIIASFPLWHNVATALKEQWSCPLVYDCHDYLAGFGNISSALLEAESRMLERCDLVAFSAQWLQDRALTNAPSIGEKSILLPNAVNPCDFEGAVQAPGSNGLGHMKTIGYVGSLNFWFDVETVRSAALQHPEWRFVLVGRVESPNFHALRALPNVQFRGEIPYREISRHLSGFDVAIIPFLRSPLTLATNPIKLYEYFACGLPVVSASLPEVERFGDLVYLADDPSQFVGQLEAALNEAGPRLRDRRIAVAKRESWLARCLSLERALWNITSGAGGFDAPLAAADKV